MQVFVSAVSWQTLYDFGILENRFRRKAPLCKCWKEHFGNKPNTLYFVFCFYFLLPAVRVPFDDPYLEESP